MHGWTGTFSRQGGFRTDLLRSTLSHHHVFSAHCNPHARVTHSGKSGLAASGTYMHDGFRVHSKKIQSYPWSLRRSWNYMKYPESDTPPDRMACT